MRSVFACICAQLRIVATVLVTLGAISILRNIMHSSAETQKDDHHGLFHGLLSHYLNTSISNYTPKSKDSTCSQKATERGPNQKVISFSFFGNITHGREYFKGIAFNAELMIKLYPNWVMRVYHDIPNGGVKDDALQNFTKKYGHVLDLCFAGNLPGYGNLMGTQQNMMWRFLTLVDPLVDVTLFRDLDGALSERELEAVKEWLNSSYPIHIMRDHELHNDLILGGLWGVKLTVNRTMWRDPLDRMLTDGRIVDQGYGLDQTSLADHVWPMAKTYKLVMQHDSYRCKNAEYAVAGGMRPFPTCRNTTSANNFVGSRRTVDLEPMDETCPVECRKNETCVTC